MSYKLLDILLLISLRLGRENTRIEMELIFRTFFDSFSIHQQPQQQQNASMIILNSFNTNNNSPKTTTASSNNNTQPLKIEKSRDNMTSFKSLLSSNKNEDDASDDVYYKLSYNQSNDEITGSSFKPDKLNSTIDSKFRTQSFTLLNFNNDGLQLSFLL